MNQLINPALTARRRFYSLHHRHSALIYNFHPVPLILHTGTADHHRRPPLIHPTLTARFNYPFYHRPLALNPHLASLFLYFHTCIHE